jgi:hypothetical protein
MSTTTTQSAPNGVDVTQLVETIGAIKQDPTLATFRFRAKNTWLGGVTREPRSKASGVLARRMPPANGRSSSRATSHPSC